MTGKIAVVCAALLLAACATRESSSGTYSQSETGKEQTVRFATVEAVRPVATAERRAAIPRRRGAPGALARRHRGSTTTRCAFLKGVS